MLSEHHVNIISSNSQAGGDRVAKMRFEFELSEASHLETLLSRLRTIDSVYDAYRVVPGANIELSAHRPRTRFSDLPLVEQVFDP